MRFDSRIESLEGGRVQRIAVLTGDRPLSYGEVIDLWRGDTDFCAIFNQLLADIPFAAYFWETPALILSRVGRDFEFTVTDCPPLAGVAADAGAFARYFASAGAEPVTVFPNINHDALLVAPCPHGPLDAYPHLAAFSRKAARAQQLALWRRVGESVHQRLSDRPLWVSTSGMGVYWLHVRLDDRPKYYTWRPYTALE